MNKSSMTLPELSSGKINSENSKDNLKCRAWNLLTGNIVKSQNTLNSTITLGPEASITDNEYTGKVIEIVNGPGANRSYLIVNYIGATKLCTIDGHIEIIPDKTSKYIIHLYSGVCQEQTQNNKCNTITLSANLPKFNGLFNNGFIKFLSNTNGNTTKKIINYDDKNIVTVDNLSSISITSKTLFFIIGEHGTASGGGLNSIMLQKNHGHNLTNNYYEKFMIEIISGPGEGEACEIISYNPVNLECKMESNFTTAVTAKSLYNIYPGWRGCYYADTIRHTESTILASGSIGESFIIEERLSSTVNGLSCFCEYTESKSTHLRHTQLITSNYYNMRLVTLGTEFNGSIQTIFHNNKSKALTSSIESLIDNTTDCEISRSIITGKTSSGHYKNAAVSNNGLLKTAISRPLNAFGELQTAPLTPTTQIHFPYYKNTNLITESFNHGTMVEMKTEGNADTQQVQHLYLPHASLFTQSGAANYFKLYSAEDTTQYFIWYKLGKTSIAPLIQGTGIPVPITPNDNAIQVAAATVRAINKAASVNFTVIDIKSPSNFISITNKRVGTTTSIEASMPFLSLSSVSYNSINSLLSLTNELGIGSSVTVSSTKIQKYRPGQGGVGRFNAIFANPTKSVQQIAGIGNQINGFFFGVNPVDGEFGILHRTNGFASIHVLTINSSIIDTTDITLTLDGICFRIPATTLTPNSTIEHNAYEIVQQRHVFLAGRWLVEQIGSAIFFISEILNGPRTGTFDVAPGIDASWTTITQGTAVTDNWIPQYNWNELKLDGYNNNYSYHLNPTKGNVYQIQHQCLSYGVVKFSVEDPLTGIFVDVHTIHLGNQNITSGISQPAMKLIWSINNTVVTTSSTMSFSSGALFTEGTISQLDNIFGHTISKAGSYTNEVLLVTYKNRRIFQGKENNTTITPKLIGLTNNSTQGAKIRIYINDNLTNYNYQYINENTSTMVFSSQGQHIEKTGTLAFSTSITKDSTIQINLETLGEILHLSPNYTLTITVQTIALSNIDVSADIHWIEYQ